MNAFKNCCQPRNDLVNYENCYLLADHNNMLDMWKNDFSQLLDVNSDDVRLIEIYKVEMLMPRPSPFEAEIALQSWKSTNCQVVINFQQNRFKHAAKYYGLISINSYILFGIRWRTSGGLL
jgi:hypothetical protein